MSRAKLAFAAAAVVLTVSACGTVNVKPGGTRATASRGRVDNPATAKTNHVACLRANKLDVQEIGITQLLINGAVRVQFEPTPGAAQSDQIEGRAQNAEVIGAALVYPGAAPDDELGKIETCLAAGVSG